MKILIESINNAYMLRNDGTAFGVVQHLYANPDDVEETLYAAEWLHEHTRHGRTQVLVINLIHSWFASRGIDDVESACHYVDAAPYRILTSKFVENNWSAISSAEIINISEACKQINDELNQEFLRVRYGGMYNTERSSRELVFRVSSSGFNWYNLIWDMAYKYKNYASSITIVRDEESTGAVDQYYTSRSGELYKQMPIDDFILESGNNVVECNHMIKGADSYSGMTRRIYEALGRGQSLAFLRELPLNGERLLDKLARIRTEETALARKS